MPVYRFELVTVSTSDATRTKQTVDVELPFEMKQGFTLDEFKQLETRVAQEHVSKGSVIDGLVMVDRATDDRWDVLSERESRFGFETELHE